MSITVDPIGVVLDILASGTKPIADEATKDFYHYLKSSFQSKFANNPKVQLALDEYEKEPDEELKALLTRQLKAANIDQDPEILKFLEKNPLQAATGNQNLQNFKSDTATTGATISKDNLSANRDAIKVGRDQVIHNRQSLLAVLLWFLALALTGVIGFGAYLFMNGRLQLPGSLPFRSSPSPTSSSPLRSVVGSPSSPEEIRRNECKELIDVLVQISSDRTWKGGQTSQELSSEYEKYAGSLDRYAGSFQAIDLKDEKLLNYQTRFITNLSERSQSYRAFAKGLSLTPYISDNELMQLISETQLYERQWNALTEEFDQFCQNK